MRVTDKDDLWYLSHLIDPGDFVRGKTTRKIKIGESENAKVTKKTMTLMVEAETVEFGAEGSTLRINGKIKEGPEDVAKDSYHSIMLETGSEFTLQKVNWLEYQKQKLREATEVKYTYLICIFDREEALFALTKKFGYDILAKVSGEVPKKGKEVQINKNFYEEITKALEVYNDRHTPEHIILASPAFYKEDLLKQIRNNELKQKIVLATASSVTESALDEVIKRPELKTILQDSRTRQEQLLVEEVLQEIQREGLVAYGMKEAEQAITAGAVRSLLVTDGFIAKLKEEHTFQSMDEAMKKVDALKGEVHLISSQFDPGKRLDGLGGIAALLRYKIR